MRRRIRAGPHRGFFFNVPQDANDAAALVNGVIRREDQLRRIPEGHPLGQLPTEVAGGGLQALDHVLPIPLVQGTDIHLTVPQIRRGVHSGNGDQATHPGIFQIGNELCQLPLDVIVDAYNSISCHVNGFSFFTDRLPQNFRFVREGKTPDEGFPSSRQSREFTLSCAFER